MFSIFSLNENLNHVQFTSRLRPQLIALFNNIQTVKFKTHHVKCVLRCSQSCHGPLRNKCDISQIAKGHASGS